MRRLFTSLTPLSGGFFLLVLIYFVEYYTGVSCSVAYVLTSLFILWFSWNSPYTAWIAILATGLLVMGSFLVDNNTALPTAINRVLAIVTIWIAVVYAKRFRKLAEAEGVQKHQLEALFANATEGILFANAAGEIVRINPAAENMFGYDHNELLGKKVELLIPDKFAEAHVARRKEVFKTPRVRPKGSGRQLMARKKDGSEFPSEISLSYFLERTEMFYIAFVLDISQRKRQEQIIDSNMNAIRKLNTELDAKVRLRTLELESANAGLIHEVQERKRVEERLTKSQQLYLAIARNFPEGVIGVLDRNMRYVLAAGQELEKIGYASSDPIGGRLFSNESEALNLEAEPIIARAFDGDSVSFDVDIRDSVYNVVAVPLPDADANVTEVLVVMKNITERKYAERKLVKAIEKEKELGVLKSRFVTMASHEFRTPLSTMLSSVFLLQNYSGDKYEAHKKQHLEKITRSIATLTELMNDFLSIGSLEEGHIKAVYSQVEIGALMREIVADLQAIKKAGQTLRLEFSGDEVTLMMDRQMLSSILRNLVSNAVKYSSADSEIRIECTVKNDHLIISVEDSGMGIPEHEQGEIFKRFYRAENAVNIQGTGLGLNIVWKYVNILKGSIGFTSKINKGSKFTVKIPVTVQQISIAN